MTTCLLARGERVTVSRITRERETPFGQWLMSNREARGLSMRALAEKINVTHAHISKLESGSQPSREMVKRLTEALKPEGADEETERKMLQDGLRAAFGIEEEEYQYPTERAALHSIIRERTEAGYDDGDDIQQMTDEEVDELRRGMRAFADSWIREKRRREGRD